LVINNDRSVDIGTNKSLDKDVKVRVKRSSRITNRNPHMDKSWELFFQSLNDTAKGFEILDFNLFFCFIDVNIFKFSIGLLSTSLNNLKKLFLICFN